MVPREIWFESYLAIVKYLGLHSVPVTSVSSILIPYHRSLNLHIELVNSLRSHSISFQESRDMILKWAQQPWLQEDGWDAKWEDICVAEVERWGKRDTGK